MIIIIITIRSNVHTGLLVQDRDPVISQGLVERKMKQEIENYIKVKTVFKNASL